MAITGPILVEMIQGCRTEEEKKNLKEVFAGIHRFPIAEVLWEDTADLSFALRRKGITVSAVDALIATVAINSY